MIIIIFEIFPQLNEMLELVPLPESLTYKFGLIGIMAANFVLCYLLENWPKLLGFYKM